MTQQVKLMQSYGPRRWKFFANGPHGIRTGWINVGFGIDFFREPADLDDPHSAPRYVLAIDFLLWRFFIEYSNHWEV